MPNRTSNVSNMLEKGPERIVKDKSNPLEYYKNDELSSRCRFSKESVLCFFYVIKNDSILALRGKAVAYQQFSSQLLLFDIMQLVIFK